MMYRLRQRLARVLVMAIRGYRWSVSPLLGPSCRFFPSCSEYAEQALERHGPWGGTRLGLRRLLRCQPLHPGGYDPVP